MASELEVTKRILFSEAYNRYDTEDISIEDCRFLNFTEFLEEIDVFNNPTPARSKGVFKNGKWSLLGYSSKGYQQIKEEVEEEEVEEEEEETSNNSNFEIKWEYTIFNGYFSDDNKIENLTQKDIDKSTNETIRFLEKTFSKNYINDVCEARELQNQILKQFGNNNLDRIDICIITDKLIPQDNLPAKIKLKNANIECRIYYWDLQRWNDLKRSKSKREPIDIDFKTDDYKIYNVPFLKKTTQYKLNYFLAIFPGDLIADLYDEHNTRLLENNVRVFLSATKKANKGIRNTIKDEAYKFFSFNNGISATAETIETKGNDIVKIHDFQIVNGGQTSATIHYSKKKDGNSLEEVYVAVKITELQKNNEYSKIVSKISQAANTQSAIANSDFYANDKLLVDMEQFSRKNPVQNNLERNIYYFFERMKGQYNVSKISRGTKTQQKNWVLANPKSLLFNKIDLARWSNIKNLMPHIASTGAEKQFKDFMDNKFYEREQISFGRYKTLVGIGLTYKRIKKLCGKSNGKTYPSLIIDPNTKKHVPVAMSTAIYSASYIHMITNGNLDYWSFYDYEHKLCESINSNPERINSKLDHLFEEVIKACWLEIAKFGGAAAQEKSKEIGCWDYVKKNTKIDKAIIKELNTYCITEKEKTKRETLNSSNENINYFKFLEEILENNGRILLNIFDVSKTQSNYLGEKATIKNFIKKIDNKTSLLRTNKVEEIYKFYKTLKTDGFDLEKKHVNEISISIDFINIFNTIFKNKETFLEKFENFVYEKEEDFEENEQAYNNTKEIIDKFYREYGLTIQDFEVLNNTICAINM